MEVIRVWQIGTDGTEYYAARSEEEMKAYYRELCGSEDHCESDLRDHFEEIPAEQLDAEFDFEEDGKMIRTTWRKLAEQCDSPSQISTGYN